MLIKNVTEHLKDLLVNGNYLWYDYKTSEFVITVNGLDNRGYTLAEVIERCLWYLNTRKN